MSEKSNSSKSTGKPVRVSVTFPAKYYAMLTDLEIESGSTKADVIRDALAFQSWLQQVRREGGRLLVKRKNGDLAEVVRP